MVGSQAIFLAPLALCALASAHCARSARESDRGRRWVWVSLGIAAALQASSCIGALAGAAGEPRSLAGALASTALLAGAAGIAGRTLPGAARARPFDVVVFAGVLAAIAVPEIIIPDARGGAPIAASAFALDFLAVVTVLAATTVQRPRRNHNVAWALAGACLMVSLGDALGGLAAAGRIAASPWQQAIPLALAAYLLAAAAALELTPVREDPDAEGQEIRVVRRTAPQPSPVASSRVRGSHARAPAEAAAGRSRS